MPDNLYKDKDLWEKLYAVEAELASQDLEENIQRAGLSGVVEIRLGKAQETFPRLVKRNRAV